jgi:transposase
MGHEARKRWPVSLHAFVTFFQMVEELSDTQASDAVRSRIDWQYALHLPANFPGLHEDELCAYRQFLLSDAIRLASYRTLVDHLRGLFEISGNSPCEHSEIEAVTVVCYVNRLRWIVQAICDLLGVLASGHPDWLASIARPHWYVTYRTGQPFFSGRACCATQDAIDALAVRLNDDVHFLLSAMETLSSADAVEVSYVTALRRVWRQQFEQTGRGARSLRSHCSFCSQVANARQQE